MQIANMGGIQGTFSPMVSQPTKQLQQQQAYPSREETVLATSDSITDQNALEDSASVRKRSTPLNSSPSPTIPWDIPISVQVVLVPYSLLCSSKFLS